MKALRTLAAELRTLAAAAAIDPALLTALAARLDKEIGRIEFQTKRLQKDKAMMAALLTNTSRDLEASLLAQKRFLASVSHEIRTPLNSIIGFMELLADTPLTERQREYLQNSLGSSRHLLALINDVLDVSKIEAGQVEFSEKETSLEDLLLEALSIISGRVDASRVSLEAHIPELDHLVLADAVRLRQIFLNLLGNAAKFTTEGYIRLRLLAAEAAGSDRLAFRVAVEDSGVGIPADKLAALFLPFKQAHGAAYGGTGLGLFLSRALARLMSGDITAESEEGRGSRFVVHFQLKKGRHRELGFTFDGRTVLIAGAAPATRGELADKFRRVGAQVVDTTHARILDVVAEVRTRPRLDAALIDLDGFAGRADHLAGVLRELHPDLIVIGISRRPLEAALTREFTNVLVKPVSFSRVATVLHHAIGGATPTPRLSPEEAASRHVLLVEDVQLNVRLIQELLRALFGIRPEIARNGAEAVEMVRHTRFDLVLMDIQMPVMDGIRATREIRQFDAEVPIVALSANAFAEDIDEARAAGMNDFITKPVQRQELERVFRTLARPRPPGDNGGPTGRTVPEDGGRPARARALTHLAAEYGDDTAAAVIAVTAGTLGRLTAALEQASAAGDVHGAALAFHSLKGSFHSLGLHEAGQIASEAEALLAAGASLADTATRRVTLVEICREFDEE